MSNAVCLTRMLGKSKQTSDELATSSILSSLYIVAIYIQFYPRITLIYHIEDY